MKKYLVSFAFAVLFFAGCKSDSGVDDLRKEIEALKSTEIASVNSQITGIKSSISDLQKVDAELKGYIKTLQDALTALDGEIDDKYASLQKDIEDLEKADAALSKRIDELKDYCDQQNSSTREWVATTFTTLEQHSEVLEEIAAIKLQLGELGNSITTLDSSLSKKISDSEDKVMAAIGTTENSVKSWVNEQLSGYYTIAAADAKLKLLEDAYKAGDTSLAGDIKTLQESLNTAKSDLTAAYQKAIADAITENNGTINKKIADDIKAAADNLQSQINAINTRIDALESRVAALEASVAELIGMVQSIVVVPDYSDGSVKMTSSSDNIIRFEVYPLSAAKALAEKGPSVFSLDYIETQTKAGSLINLPISKVSFDGEFVSIIADGSGVSENITDGLASANARLRISSGKAVRSSEYFQLTYVQSIGALDVVVELLPVGDMVDRNITLNARVSGVFDTNDDIYFGFIISQQPKDLFLSSSQDWNTLKTRLLTPSGTFSGTTQHGLLYGTKYYYRAFVSKNGLITHSDIGDFMTTLFDANVTTLDAVVDYNHATLNGQLSLSGSEDNDLMSVVYFLCSDSVSDINEFRNLCSSYDPSSNDGYWFFYNKGFNTFEVALSTDGTFTYATGDLPLGKTYYYLAYAVVENQLFLGETKTFSTDPYSISGTITGDDANPIAGVVVSDGINCVKTDSQGKYYLPSNLSTTEYVFVSTPSGYSAPKEDGHAIFWKFLKDCNKGSNGKYEIPFTLNKIPNPERFTIFIFADPQPRKSTANLDKVAFHSLEMCQDMYLDMKEYAATMSDRPVYAIGLGDIVHQDVSLLDQYRAGMASTLNITTYNVIGNHDQQHKLNTTDKEASKAFEAKMGPCNYSFNLGGMHFLMLDNMIAPDHSATTYSDECATGLTDDIWTFVQNDLKYVPVSTPLMVCAHSPMVQLQGGGLRSGAHLGDLRNLLSKYVKAYVWAGHTHTTFNYVDKNNPTIETHTLTRVTGQLWHNDYLGGNGTPRGYTVFEYSNGDVQWKFKPLYYQTAEWVGSGSKPDYSLRDWDYDASGRAVLKSTGANLDDSYQMQVFKPGTYGDSYVYVNVFLWDELWKTPVFTAGGVQTVMKRVNPSYSYADWTLASFYHTKVSDITAMTDNCSSIFRAYINPEGEIHAGTVSVRDRFGNDYSQTVSW